MRQAQTIQPTANRVQLDIWENMTGNQIVSRVVLVDFNIRHHKKIVTSVRLVNIVVATI
jgi:hypothetical protein|tara:strand:+ start:748 stop:924 length:177 start_codon:yes stop_codon:yes gene_type:complete